MAFTNSPLVDYTQISPNRTKNRNHEIDTITIHCVVGQCSVQTLGAVFAPTSRQASSNYGIGYDGKIGMYFSRKRHEKKETAQTLKEVKQLLGDVNAHYSADNITKRDSWMQWVNNRADVYDSSIVEIKNQLTSVTEVLEELFVQNSRDRIIDFATKVTDGKNLVSREEFNRIFKVHAKYEAFLEDRKMTNGEVDVAILVIQESYAQHMKEHTFLEDVRGYSSKN